MKRLILLLGILSLMSLSAAELSLQNLYTDHMVLQRGRPVPIRGRAAVGSEVTVMFNGQKVSAITETNGQWRAVLAPMDVLKTGTELTVSCGDERVTCSDVLVGDVWLCSGQSNMAFTFGRGIHDGKKLMDEMTRCPLVRVLRVANSRAIEPVDYYLDCQPWSAATAKNVNGFTACGSLFAMEVNRATGVPVGIIQNAWSGKPIEPFICREGYELVPETAATKRIVDRRVKDLSTRAGRADYNWVEQEMLKWAKTYEAFKARGERYPLLPLLDHRLGGGEASLFHNAMIEPLVAFPIAGVLWYQGESNGGAGMDYYYKLKALVGGWRAKWGYEFPFYLVQLAAYKTYNDSPAGGEEWCATRDAMRLFCQDYPKCGMAVAIDIGNETDIHPKDKLDVARRLARWALRDVYGQDIVPCGPLYRDFQKEGSSLRVRFDHVGAGLVAAEKDPTGSAIPPVFTDRREVKGFAIAGADRKWVWAKAVIDGHDVVVSAPEVKEPVAVRYAYRMNPMGHADLFNREGLPAAPFRSDDWK